MRQILGCIFILVSFFLSVFYISHAQAVPMRVGGALGLSTWSDPYALASIDTFGPFAHKASIGADVEIIDSSLLIEPRLLFWEKGNMSGFYGGPKVSLGPIGHLSPLIGIGGDFGWAYRFPRHFDLGGGLQLLASSHGTMVGLHFSAGYLIP